MRRPLHPEVYAAHGSSDAITHALTGWEWFRVFRVLPTHLTYFLGIAFSSVAFSSAFLMSNAQGRLATALLESDFASPADFIEQIDAISWEMIATLLALFLCHLASGVIDGLRMAYVLQDIGSGVLRAILAQDIAFFDRHDASVALSRVQADSQNAFDAFTEKGPALVRFAYQSAFGFLLVATMHWKLFLTTCALLPLFAMAEVLGNRAIERLWLRFNNRVTDVSAKAHEILTQFRTVRSFDAERREYEAYKARLESMHAVVCDTARVHAIKEALSLLVLWGTIAALLFLSGTMAARGEIESGYIVTLFTMVNVWSFSFAGIFSSLTEFRQANVSSAKLNDIFENPVTIPLNRGRDVGRVAGRIEFRDVTFRYPNRSENAIDGLSFTIEPGETVAVVGESGCGKSTALALIQRFYDVDEGAILLDGVDLRDISPMSLRRQVSIVPQAPIMFTMSVKDNIRFGVPQAARDEVVGAAETANAAGFIAELPRRYNTPVAQASLSGGQKQRLCIARAVMMRAPVLLLDEATAALDTENEGLVQDALQRYGAERTTIIVAHRLATVAHASRIMVMDHGRIAQIGTHEELLQDSEGVYARLVKHQLQ
jgi:ABC-type multidrug transport system fused ATPase/permease subunit